VTREEYTARLRSNLDAVELQLSRAARRVDEAEASGSASAEEIERSRAVTLPSLAAQVAHAEKALANYLRGGS